MSTQVSNNNDPQDWPLSNEKIKEKLEDLKKNEKMSRINIMILRTLLFSFIGQLISFLTLTQYYISKSVVEAKNPTIMMILLLFQFLIMTLIMILFKMKIKRPKFAYLIISLIYVANISLDLFAYKQDSSNHMLIVFMWSLIALSIYVCIVSKGKFSLNQLLGFVLSTIGIIMILSFILYSIYNSDLSFFNDGFLNNLVAIVQGMAFAA